MSSRRRIIVAGDSAWRVGIDRDAGVTFRDVPAVNRAPDDLARDVKQALMESGYRGEPVVIALPSRWCLPATIDVTGLPRRNRRRLMLYRFEERVPLPAEELAVDFVAADGGAALGVAVPTDKLRRALDALDAAGVTVDSVAPLALVAAQSGCDGHAAVRSCDAIVWAAGGSAEVVIIRGGAPTAWYVVRADADDLRVHLRAPPGRPLASPVRVACFGLVPICRQLLADVTAVEVIAVEPLDLEVAAAEFVGGSTRAPWFELRRDGLAPRNVFRRVRGPAIVTGVAAVLLFVAACAAPLWRAAIYQREVDRNESRQAVLFRSAIPGRPVPSSVLSRLESERRRLAGVSGDGAAAKVPPRHGGTRLLLDVLERLPADVRFRVSDLRLGDDKLYLEGQARSHADANGLAESLRRAGVLAIDPPQTEQRPDRSVGFVITGSRTAAQASVSIGGSK